MEEFVGFISCSGQKLDKPCEAQNLYCSPLFRLSKSVIERTVGMWFILSAKYGLLRPNEVVAPYDKNLATMNAAAREQWSELVRPMIQRVVGDKTIVSFCYESYAGAFVGLPNKLIEPLKGLGQGRRMHELKRLGGKL